MDLLHGDDFLVLGGEEGQAYLNIGDVVMLSQRFNGEGAHEDSNKSSRSRF